MQQHAGLIFSLFEESPEAPIAVINKMSDHEAKIAFPVVSKRLFVGPAGILCEPPEYPDFISTRWPDPRKCMPC